MKNLWMKRGIAVMAVCLTGLAAMAQTRAKDCVEVVYFHGKQRCATCIAIERQAREVVENDFAGKKGQVVFKVVDISTQEGGKMAKDYRVTWSSLYINGWKDGKEKRNDMTQFAFKNARKNAAEFKKGVKGKIQELLK